MTEDASIDEFTGSDDGTDEEEGTDADGVGDVSQGVDGEADGGEASVAERVRTALAAASTSRYAPGGAACADCGVAVERLWFADDDAVCADCKSW